MAATIITAAGARRSELETSTIRTISWRLIPFLVLAYFFSYLDRLNLGFAALTMNAELKFSPIVFAWGAGIFFIGLFHLRSAEQSGAGKVRRQPLDREDHGDLGHYFGMHGAGVRCLELLHAAFSPRRGGGRIFPRHHPLSDLLVSGRISRAIPRRVRHRRSGFDRDRRADLGTLARARRRDGPERVAMAVHHRGGALGPARHRYLVLSDRQTRARQLAHRRAEGLACGQARCRDRGQRGGQALHAWRGAVLAESDHAVADLFRLRRCPLWHAVLAAAD